MVLVLAFVGVLSGCAGAGNSVRSDGPPVEDSKADDETSSMPINPRELREYLSGWEASWRRRVGDLEGGDEGALGFSSTPDASWERARRYYDEAVAAYRDQARRLVALAPPAAMREAHDAYLAAVRRQAARFEMVADSLRGSDPFALERALEALSASQMEFDLDGAAWEEAVIRACKASGVEVPEIVGLGFISNGHRTAAG
jgi:hypothetical protein